MFVNIFSHTDLHLALWQVFKSVQDTYSQRTLNLSNNGV